MDRPAVKIATKVKNQKKRKRKIEACKREVNPITAENALNGLHT
jgi:hypothetical protein